MEATPSGETFPELRRRYLRLIEQSLPDWLSTYYHTRLLNQLTDIQVDLIRLYQGDAQAMLLVKQLEDLSRQNLSVAGLLSQVRKLLQTEE